VLVVAALGGNALAQPGEPLDIETQRRSLRVAAEALAELAGEHSLVVTHGNGPQVGLLALQSEAYEGAPPSPLDVLGAESEGMIGYLLEQELRQQLPDRELATLLTQVEVDDRDPAFEVPRKPIGPSYPAARARELAESRGWIVAAQQRGGFRRVVPSPEPRRILELAAIRVLLAADVLVICAGGGGVPVVRSAEGGLRGVEAVIDKDLASGLLARQLAADALLLLTDQPAVFSDWPEPARRPIRQATVAELRAHAFEPGSMGPKVEAACRFVEATGGRAGIGALRDAARILAGTAGTSVGSVARRP
jgi:carbamate kinase